MWNIYCVTSQKLVFASFLWAHSQYTGAIYGIFLLFSVTMKKSQKQGLARFPFFLSKHVVDVQIIPTLGQGGGVDSKIGINWVESRYLREDQQSTQTTSLCFTNMMYYTKPIPKC